MAQRIKQWKGCQLCKGHKDRRFGQAVRKPARDLRNLGKARRVGRHDLPLE